MAQITERRVKFAYGAMKAGERITDVAVAMNVNKSDLSRKVKAYRKKVEG